MTDSALQTPGGGDWQDLGNCLGVDPELFFPGRGASTKEAKEVCAGCIVKVDCLEYALSNGEKFGIWGGASERERRRIRRQRRLEREAAGTIEIEIVLEDDDADEGDDLGIASDGSSQLF